MKRYIYEDGYGDDGCPIYLCPTCMVELIEHQETCHFCGQELCWNEEELI